MGLVRRLHGFPRIREAVDWGGLEELGDTLDWLVFPRQGCHNLFISLLGTEAKRDDAR